METRKYRDLQGETQRYRDLRVDPEIEPGLGETQTEQLASRETKTLLSRERLRWEQWGERQIQSNNIHLAANLWRCHNFFLLPHGTVLKSVFGLGQKASLKIPKGSESERLLYLQPKTVIPEDQKQMC